MTTTRPPVGVGPAAQAPPTSAARADFSRRKVPFEYINVLEDDAGLERMLKLTNGRRKIPVIVDAGKITVGFGGS